MIETIKNFKFIADGDRAMSEETKNEAIEFLRFLVVFSGGYAKYLKLTNSIFNLTLNLWLCRLIKEGFSQRKLNGLCLKFGYSLKTEDFNAR